ncbi:hypothetical protein FGIG_01043 [Fasciola gigantica]|uniref:Uncharacterized protein n=1 Tax=Fasciola gigantica TaxID=46835 RepID=A0A504Y7J1_FASGI|nr:hypothetical protein FGIG_01043 [Fasciola gigantica]
MCDRPNQFIVLATGWFGMMFLAVVILFIPIVSLAKPSSAAPTHQSKWSRWSIVFPSQADISKLRPNRGLSNHSCALYHLHCYRHRTSDCPKINNVDSFYQLKDDVCIQLELCWVRVCSLTGEDRKFEPYLSSRHNGTMNVSHMARPSKSQPYALKEQQKSDANRDFELSHYYWIGTFEFVVMFGIIILCFGCVCNFRLSA